MFQFLNVICRTLCIIIVDTHQFIGLGLIGGNMVENLQKRDFKPIVMDLNKEIVASVVARGGSEDLGCRVGGCQRHYYALPYHLQCSRKGDVWRRRHTGVLKKVR